MKTIATTDAARAGLLRRIPVFRELSAAALGRLMKIAEEVSFAGGETVFSADEPADALYLILKGEIRIEQVYRDGRRKILACLAQGSFFGEMAVVTEHKRCATAIAEGDCELIRIDKASFREALRGDAELCFNVLQVICERLRLADEEIGNLTFRNLPGRIAAKIFELADQFGVLQDGGTLIQLEMTHYDLADMVGTNRETVSRFLAKFRREGAIELRGRRIFILDRQKLRSWR